MEKSKHRLELERYFDVITKNTYTCKCGCRNTIGAQRDYVVCKWCNRLVFKNPKDEFEHRLRSKINEFKGKGDNI